MATVHIMEPVSSHVALLHRISNIVSSELSLDEMLGEIVGLTVQVTDCDACLVYLLDRDSDEVVLRASQVPHAAALGNLRMKVGEGVTGWVAEHKSVVALSTKASADARFKRFQTLVEDTYEAFLSVPLVSGGDVIGVINVHHRNTHNHNGEEISLLTFVGEQMGGAIAKSSLSETNARLIEETLEMRRQLETRKLVERAKGILQRDMGFDEERAYLALQQQSRQTRKSMKQIAEAVIMTDEMKRAARPDSASERASA